MDEDWAMIAGDRSPVTEQARQRERRFDGARDLG